jgi:hypothetical protein
MALRPPTAFARASGAGSNFSRLETEILGEAAAALGHYGRRVEDALARLDATGNTEREVLLQDAADAVWAYFIQRELAGFGDHRFVIREMKIPPEVLNRMGSFKKKDESRPVQASRLFPS